MATPKAKVKAKPVSAQSLLRWYDRHRRVMPWRALPHEVADPYRVWLSEVMLQQTTVVVVTDYFTRFIARWPTVQDLAAAHRDDVLRMWAGLGYYRRAHLLHECAQAVCRDFGGIFPNDEAALLKLSGIGPYTAAAIAAIAFGKKANVVDGNVERVMTRIFNIQTPLPKAKAEIKAWAAELLPAQRCGDYAQALMDLGATICTPRSPQCEACPWSKGCAAYAAGTAGSLPRKEKKQQRPVRYAVAFVMLDAAGRVLLQKRPDGGLLGGMLEVPSSPWIAEPVSLAVAKKYAPCRAAWHEREEHVVHVFSHFMLKVRVLVAHAKSPVEGHWVRVDDSGKEALPSVMQKILRHGIRRV